MAAAMLAPDILIAKRRRLSHLEHQAAQMGIETPPHIATEIADLQGQIGAAAPESVGESHTILYALLMETRADVRRLYWLLPLLLLLLAIAVKL